MNTYDIHFFKTSNLSADEKNAMRRNASGIWLCGGRIEAKSARAACAAYRKSGELGSKAAKLRAKLHLGVVAITPSIVANQHAVGASITVM